MEQWEFIRQGFEKDEWLVSGEETKCRLQGRHYVFSGLGNQTIYMSYRTKTQVGISIPPYLRQGAYTLSIQCMTEQAPTLRVEVIVSYYYTNGYIKKQRISEQEKKNGIVIRAEAIDSIYIALQVQGEGWLGLELLSIQGEKYETLNKAHPKYSSIVQALRKQELSPVKQGKWPKTSIKVATILDEISYSCWKYEAQLEQLNLATWREQLRAFQPDFLFVESAWKGNEGSWAGRVATVGSSYDSEIFELVSECRERNIPTVFWDKEGLNNFLTFISTASLFDYVGVTDERLLPIHRAARAANKVFLLPFAAQPYIHYKRYQEKEKIGEVAFAGAWYDDKYPKRLKDVQDIIRPATGFDFDLYDRNYGMNASNTTWPKQYTSYIVGQLTYEEMVKLYSAYSIYLNIQSVHESEWMMPRRVYELLASEVCIISSYGKGIEQQFGEYVWIAKSEEDTKRIIQQVVDAPYRAEGKCLKGKEMVLRDHTYTERMGRIIHVLQRDQVMRRK